MKQVYKWLGLEKRDDFVNEYFAVANFRASLYMSVVIIVLEGWMILSLAIRWLSGDRTRTTDWYVSHATWYGVMIVSAVMVVYFSLGYLKKRLTGPFMRFIGQSVLGAFALVSLIFGMNVSISDYSRGEQILCFVMMVIYVIGLLNWRPVIAITVATAAYLVFYHRMGQFPMHPISYATKVNLFTLWVSNVMLSLSVYQQRLSEAEKENELEKASVRDDLTGIPNFPTFRTKAARLMQENGVDDRIFLFLDIENFKSYNEKYGFEMGNECIRDMARLISQVFEEDLYARFSDDHFVVLTRRSRLDGKLRQLQEGGSRDQDANQISLKVGAYEPRHQDVDPSIACDHARYACSMIKKHYDHDYCEYDREMDAGFRRRQYIVTHIEEAVEKGYIRVFYQPVVSAKDRTLCGLEALARWVDPIYGFLSPADFIPALEEYRLIGKLDKAVIEIVCRDLQESITENRRVVPVSVNISRLDFELLNVPALFRSCLETFEIQPHFLHAEITESALVLSEGVLKKATEQLKELGSQLWLDDFGSGYSSLNVLKDYDFDVMKIDMSFLKNFEGNEKSRTILKSITAMASLIGMRTVCEGVETAEAADFLTQIGCERLQGYYFGKPMPLSEIWEKGEHFA